MVKRKVKRLKGERLILFAIVLILSVTPLLHVFTKAQLSESNFEVEKLKLSIEEQKKVNESLNMKINELASLDKIREVAVSAGLSYNNDNIKVIDN